MLFRSVSSPSLFSATATPSTVPSSATVSAHKAGPNAAPGANLNGDLPNDPLPSDSDDRMDRIWADYESVEPYLINEAVEETVMDVKIDYAPQLISSRPFHVSICVRCRVLMAEIFHGRTCCRSSSTSRIARASCTALGLRGSGRRLKVGSTAL